MDTVSHCASLFYLNGRSESSSFRAYCSETLGRSKFKAKNKVFSTGVNEHISVTEPVEVTGNAFCAQNSFPTLKKYKFSEQENISCEFYEVKLVSKSLICDAGTQALRHKVQSDASDGLPATDEMPSETSDALPATDEMPSETSDALPATDKVQSEASDDFTATDRMLSEVSDGFIATDKALPEASDGLPVTDRALSETSDGFTATDKAPSEVSDGFTATDRALSDVSDTSTAIESRSFALRRNDRYAGGGIKKYSKGVYL